MLVFCLLLWGVFPAVAQQAKMARADQLQEQLNFQKAIRLYEKVERKYHLPEAMIGLAECYRRTGDFQKAETWYQKALLGFSNPDPVWFLQLGRMLQRNGKCEQAGIWFRQYYERMPPDSRQPQLLDVCALERELGSKGVGIYELFPVSFNSPAHDFSPVFFEGGLLFASDRKEDPETTLSAWTGSPFTRLYAAPIEQLDAFACFPVAFGTPEPYSERLRSPLHDASAAYCPQTGELFVTQNVAPRRQTDLARLTISIFRLDAKGNWTRQEPLPIQNLTYSIAHPAISPGGERLYFASDMPGGFGGMDLYYLDRLSGSWSAPRNLGPAINTEGNEVFPVFQEGGALLFASDGHPGLGGLDIWESRLLPNGEWTLPLNPGFPINSTSDDFGLIWAYGARCGFLSSNREGGKGKDDIYLVHKVSIPATVTVRQAGSGVPLEGVLVTSACAGIQAVTDESGVAELELPLSRCCLLKVEANGFQSATREHCTYHLSPGSPLFWEVLLEERVELTLEGNVFDKGTGLPLAYTQVVLQNSCRLQTDQRALTDATGHFRFSIDPDCCYRLKASKDAYLTEVASDFCTYGLSGRTTKSVDLQLQPIVFDGSNYSPSRVTTLEGVYYDVRSGIWVDARTGFPAEGVFPDGKAYENGYLLGGESSGRPPNPAIINKALPETNEPIPFYLDISFAPGAADLLPASAPSLQALQELLEENPRIIVEIGVHTDSRGSGSSNKRLSQKRAEAVVAWLTSRGVQRRRLVPVGYGETRLLNHCDDGVPCSEAEHQINHRTEFRVISCQGCPF